MDQTPPARKLARFQYLVDESPLSALSPISPTFRELNGLETPASFNLNANHAKLGSAHQPSSSASQGPLGGPHEPVHAWGAAKGDDRPDDRRRDGSDFAPMLRARERLSSYSPYDKPGERTPLPLCAPSPDTFHKPSPDFHKRSPDPFHKPSPVPSAASRQNNSPDSRGDFRGDSGLPVRMMGKPPESVGGGRILQQPLKIVPTPAGGYKLELGPEVLRQLRNMDESSVTLFLEPDVEASEPRRGDRTPGSPPSSASPASPNSPPSPSTSPGSNGGGGGGPRPHKPNSKPARPKYYKCSRCGQPKKGHVCTLADDSTLVRTLMQVDSEHLARGLGPGLVSLLARSAAAQLITPNGPGPGGDARGPGQGQGQGGSVFGARALGPPSVRGVESQPSGPLPIPGLRYGDSGRLPSVALAPGRLPQGMVRDGLGMSAAGHGPASSQ